MKRNEIYDELFNEVQTAYNFKFATRRPAVFTQVNSFPAIFLDEESEEAISVKDIAIKYSFSVNLIIYTNIGNSKTANPFVELNDIIDSISDLFNPRKRNGYSNTLNGKVESCYLSGPIYKSGNDEQFTGAIATIPINIIVANN